MAYQIAADTVVLLHLVFVLFAVLGSLLVLWRRYLLWLHLPAIIWAAWIEFRGGLCPLTPLENWLRRQGGMAGYQGGFIEHYVEPLLYPPGLTRTTQLILGAAVLIINCGLYGLLLFRIWRASRSA
ncbi:MAG: DUF2784 domain-containing protein [Thermodesulfobacteriota bacterium]|nr:DUF2784 domain-containing protein [Thermodesulfobacteriota bacterium]